MSLSKSVVRYGVIGAILAGAGLAVVGPDRLSALFTQAQTKVNASIDLAIDDPVALRSQMRQLEGEYPKRIGEVRGDLAELRQQAAALKRELEISERVVAMSNNDMEQMRSLIARAEDARATSDGAIVRVVFSEQSIDLKDAYTKATRIQQVQTAYANRAADIQRDLGYLAQQESRLSSLLTQLEGEHGEFQAQMWTLDRQVDTIARNDRLIAMMEKRQRTLDEQSRYRAGSLENLAGRFADIRAKQEAQLESLGGASAGFNYEDRAKLDLDAQKALFPKAPQTPTKPAVIEIKPEQTRPDTNTVTGPIRPIAAR